METLVTIGITSLILFGMTALMMDSTTSSDRTQTQSNTDTDVAIALEKVSALLLESRSITIDSDGCGITYRYPAESGGSYTPSAKALEAGSHRLYVSNGGLVCSDDVDEVILDGIPSTDPDTGSALRIFNVGANAKEIVIRLASSRTTGRGRTVHSAVTARLRPRNM